MLYGTPDRASAWSRLSEKWDVIVIGGGISGAGILREAAQQGLRVLLLEQNDFASGTSSRSSKLVHGGLRYLNNLQFKTTWQSVTERDALIHHGNGLISSLPFIYPTYHNDRYPSWMMSTALTIYSWMGKKWKAFQELRIADLIQFLPGLSLSRLKGGFRYQDAQADDARLVLRLIREGIETDTSLALNYARVEGLIRAEDGTVVGVRIADRDTGLIGEARATAVINATGVWADRLRGEIGASPRIRPLRGSHLIFPHYRFPIHQAIVFAHPGDGRPVFAVPWEGVTLVGTTDLDHHHDLDDEPSISSDEFDYLLCASQSLFPELALERSDVLATFAGVRPVIDDGKSTAASKASREHIICTENGLLTVTGGKLTTYRHIAIDALNTLSDRLNTHFDHATPVLNPLPQLTDLPARVSHPTVVRLVARYGIDILEFLRQCPADELHPIDALPILWLELRWAARHEAVRHLDDLLLRRVRLGLLAAGGGAKYLPQIRAIVQSELSWSDAQWDQECSAYLSRWYNRYSLPA